MFALIDIWYHLKGHIYFHYGPDLAQGLVFDPMVSMILCEVIQVYYIVIHEFSHFE